VSIINEDLCFFKKISSFDLGISLGALSMIIPVYHSEIAATQVRGRLIAIQNCAIGFGIAISSWINVGTNLLFHIIIKYDIRSSFRNVFSR